MKFNLHKFSKATAISLLSLALVAPMAMNHNIAHANPMASTSELRAFFNQNAEWDKQSTKNDMRKYGKYYHDKKHANFQYVDDYYGTLKHEPWCLDNLGRGPRMSLSYFVNHGGSSVIDDNPRLFNADHKPKGYHGPNSLRGVPFGHQHKHYAKRHIRRHRTRRNRKHAVRLHNRKHRVNRKRHTRKHVKRNRRNRNHRRHRR